MNIQAFSQFTQLSAHTLRYYEKIGLIKNIERNISGHRYFTQKDADWVEFIKRLKETDMPLKQILSYAELREAGPSTSVKRMQMLEDHAISLEANIKDQLNHLAMLKIKIKYYSDSCNDQISMSR